MELTQEQRLRSEISTARVLFEHCRHALGHQPELLRLLSLYGEAIGETQVLMQELSIAVTCTDCAKQEVGSCCFEGIESGYDHMLLLINLLMGCTIPEFREEQGSCFFVGKTGCKLQARYYFCVNYLCPGLQAALEPNAKRRLMSAVGKELAAGLELERALRGFFHEKAAEPEFMID